MNPSDEGRADRELVRRVLAGRPEAIEAFVERMRCVPRILAARDARAGRVLGREALADLGQEVFATIWRKLGEFRGDAPLEAWVYPFCVLQYMNRARKRVRRRTPVELTDREWEGEGDAEEREVESLDAAEIHLALDGLGEAEKTVIELKHFDDLTFEEIAERLGVSPNTAKTRYYRGLTKLEAALGPRFFPGEPT